MNIIDLPNSIKRFILKYLSFNDLKNLASTNSHFAILASMEMTQRWIESSERKTDDFQWINLPPSNPSNLKFDIFTTPRPVLRTSGYLSPLDVMKQGGFRRAGTEPQFLPNPYQGDEIENYLSDAETNTFQESSGDQYPWSTMVSTFDFNDQGKWGDSLSEASFYEPAINEETNICWVYFAFVSEGVITNNHFQEIATTGILLNEIIGAIQFYHPDEEDEMSRSTLYWFNPHCTAKDKYPNIYNSIKNFMDEHIKIHHLEEYIPFLSTHATLQQTLAVPEVNKRTVEIHEDGEEKNKKIKLDANVISSQKSEKKNIDIEANSTSHLNFKP